MESELGPWRLPLLGIANVSVIKQPKNCVLVTGNFLFGCNVIINPIFLIYREEDFLVLSSIGM